MKAFIYIGLTIGSVLGSYIPVWFGQSELSGWSIFGGLIGGLVGIYFGYKAAQEWS